MKKDLTNEQNDYAVFLPALSSFYATFVGKQRYDSSHVDPARIPPHLTNGVESLNYLNANEGIFNYKWSLYSAGHAELDTNKHAPKEDMIRNRDRENSWLLGDSGGFQIAKGLWEGNWTDPNCPKAHKKRELVVNWMEEYMDYGMMLDIPTWTYRDPVASKAAGIHSYEDAVTATHINAQYYMNNRKGNFKVLNVLQGSTHTDAEHWYEEFKDYCDPTKYPDTHFDGWAMGGQNMCDAHLALKRIITLIHDGLLEEGVHDVMHFLGTARIEWALLLTDIQRAIRKYHNKNFMITFDCATPFISSAKGQIYANTEYIDRGRWRWNAIPHVDDKKYSKDTRSYRDAVLQDGVLELFEDSPISAGCKISDICYYGPGDVNKIGKEGRTSWDSFSYALQMGHNVWAHINTVQEANRRYDNGEFPGMLIDERFIDRITFRDVIDEVFKAQDKDKSFEILNKHSKLWMQAVGARSTLNVGKKAVNSLTKFNELFD